MRSSISIIIAAFLGLSFGCTTKTDVPTANSNANQMSANSNANKSAETNSAPASSTGSLATPSEAYRTAYALREKKDVEGMKTIMSQEVLDFLTMVGETEKKTLDDEIRSMFDEPQAKSAEVRNEKITGNRATIEYLDEKGEWSIMDFEKVGKEWKLALPPKDEIEFDPELPEKKPR